jgi:hypothetical protein
MHDGPAGAAKRFEGAPDEVLARLREHLDGHVVGDVPPSMRLAHEVEVGLRGGRESDLDFLEADVAELRNMRILRSMFIGSKSAWLPSRRSVLIQIGAFSMIAVRPLRSTSFTGGNACIWWRDLQHDGGSWAAGCIDWTRMTMLPAKWPAGACVVLSDRLNF